MCEVNFFLCVFKFLTNRDARDVYDWLFPQSAQRQGTDMDVAAFPTPVKAAAD
jgi:hypothetical protein